MKSHKIIGLASAIILVVLMACAGNESSRSTGTYFDDKAISTKVETQLVLDSINQAIQVEVETYQGIVQLSGFVDSKEKIERAEDIARTVPGVKDVKNDLQLR